MIILYEWYISLKEKRQGYLNIIIVQCGILWHQWTSPAKAISEATPAGWKTLPFDVFNHFPAFVSLGRSPQVDSLWITCFSLSEKTSFEKKARCRVSACLLSLALVLQRATWFYRWSRGPVPFKRDVAPRDGVSETAADRTPGSSASPGRHILAYSQKTASHKLTANPTTPRKRTLGDVVALTEARPRGGWYSYNLSTFRVPVGYDWCRHIQTNAGWQFWDD